MMITISIAYYEYQKIAFTELSRTQPNLEYIRNLDTVFYNIMCHCVKQN